MSPYVSLQSRIGIISHSQLLIAPGSSVHLAVSDSDIDGCRFRIISIIDYTVTQRRHRCSPSLCCTITPNRGERFDIIHQKPLARVTLLIIAGCLFVGRLLDPHFCQISPRWGPSCMSFDAQCSEKNEIQSETPRSALQLLQIDRSHRSKPWQYVYDK